MLCLGFPQAACNNAQMAPLESPDRGQGTGLAWTQVEFNPWHFIVSPEHCQV